MGGISAERDVSLASGEAIVKALKSAGHEVIALDTAKGQNLLPDTGKYIPEGVKTKPPDVAGLEKKGKELALKAIDSFDFSEVDVIFLALHGGQGEDGTIQALLDLTGKPYTGSGVLASALAMNKAMSKKIFEREGVLTPDWFLVEASDVLVHTHLSDLRSIADRIEKNLGFPCVVKPNDQGSTVGLSIVNEKGELKKAFDFAKKFSAQFLVEKYISGRELTVGILGDQALPVVEIVPEHGVYDYECKYTSGKSNYIAPAEITKDEAKEIQKIGLKAYKALGCEGYARVDFRFGEDGRFYCLEVNTLPGMTAHSLVPKAAKALGIDFPELVDRITKLALKKNKA
ncbi:MAG: D-alanine--D-alanine ligase [candidate division Zixibacteria bacterium]|nr:D-alanine--D-alanine ligase [candidate division Zixibacteria bacterium]